MVSQIAETPAERRRLRQRTDAQRAILDATEALLVEDGYEQFSMRRLVERCGYTAPTIYRYFGDKRGLIDALLEERIRRLLSRFRGIPSERDPVETVRALAEEFVRFGLENPTHYRLLTAYRPESEPRPPAAEEAEAFFEQPLEVLIRDGRLVTKDLEEAKQCLWALLHGVISLRTSRPDYAWSSSLLATSLQALLHGLVRAAPGANPADPARPRSSV